MPSRAPRALADKSSSSPPSTDERRSPSRVTRRGPPDHARAIPVAEHPQFGPGEASIIDEQYPTPRRAPWRGARARSDTERAFLELGEPAEAIISAGAAAG